MEIRPFALDLADTWDDFVSQSRNGTLFHTRRFLSYHPEDRFKDASLLFYEGEKLRAVLPAALVEEDGKKILASHPGAAYGGLVLSRKAGAASTYDMVIALRTHAVEKGFDAVSLLRLTPAPLRRFPADDQEYALVRNGFVLSCFELGSTVILSGLTEDKLLSNFDQKCRNQVRQAERADVDVRVSDDYQSYWPILEKTLKGRHGVDPTHTREEIQKLADLFPQEIRLYAAHKDKKLIAGIVTVDVTEQSVYVKYIAQDYAYQKDRPLNAILAQILRDNVAAKKTCVHIGVAMSEGPKGFNEGIFAFKEGFGACAVRRESYVLDL